MAIVESRAYSFVLGGDSNQKTMCLLPFIDFANHFDAKCGSSTACVVAYNRNTDSYNLISPTGMDADEQVCVAYGRESPEDRYCAS